MSMIPADISLIPASSASDERRYSRLPRAAGWSLAAFAAAACWFGAFEVMKLIL